MACTVRRKAQAPAREARGNAQSRGYDRRWQRVRALVVPAYCAICDVPTHLAHHVVPVEVDARLRLDIDNLRPLCLSCHGLVHATLDRLAPGWLGEWPDPTVVWLACLVALRAIGVPTSPRGRTD